MKTAPKSLGGAHDPCTLYTLWFVALLRVHMRGGLHPLHLLHPLVRGHPMTGRTDTPFLVIGDPGPRNARLTDGGLRLYTWQGRDLPSVTTVRRLAGIPHTLHQWTLTQVIDRVVDNIGAVRDGVSGDADKLAQVRSWLRAAATDERDRRAALGTAVHDAAASGRSLADVSSEVAPFLRQYLGWLRESRAEVVLVERQVWNLTVGYAGTFDLLARFPDGSSWIVDIKTGSGIYGDHALQLCAYRHAEFVGADDVRDEAATEALRQVTGTAVLHLSPRKWEFVSVRSGPAELEAFTGLIRFAMWCYEIGESDYSLGMRKGAA